eukprot:gene16501-706_t
MDHYALGHNIIPKFKMGAHPSAVDQNEAEKAPDTAMLMVNASIVSGSPEHVLIASEVVGNYTDLLPESVKASLAMSEIIVANSLAAADMNATADSDLRVYDQQACRHLALYTMAWFRSAGVGASACAIIYHLVVKLATHGLLQVKVYNGKMTFDVDRELLVLLGEPAYEAVALRTVAMSAEPVIPNAPQEAIDPSLLVKMMNEIKHLREEQAVYRDEQEAKKEQSILSLLFMAFSQAPSGKSSSDPSNRQLLLNMCASMDELLALVKESAKKKEADEPRISADDKARNN